MEVDRALRERRSVRAFSPRPVAREVLEKVFADAQLAPSWCNIQPWRVWIASGEKAAELKQAFLVAAQSRTPEPDEPFPAEYPEPYGTHRKECGKALYAAMGVERGDHEGRQAAWLRNFVAFDAPHVAIVGIDKRFSLYGALDLGCWLQSVLLSATAEGLATCAQAALALYPGEARRILGVTDDVRVLCGIALGYEDPTAPANACRTTRDPLEKNVTFVD